MAKRVFRIENDTIYSAFHASRAKIQVFGGGFGNGKTANACIKALQLAKDYPGSNGLIARSTYPKLNDTIRKEFLKWCPTDWISRKPTKDDNTVYLKNGSVINFRYVSQQSRGEESSSSNLLSATYDWIIVDQIEDPEFVEKDLLDMLGRLRGSTRYEGDDPTMPSSGPRFLIVTCNPTRNWFYRKVVKPFHHYQRTGQRHPDLMCDANGKPILELFEGPTHANKDNLEPDFIETLEATYRGQMRDRYLLGKWSAYEGLVYPQFTDETHLLSQKDMLDYLDWLYKERYRPEFYEAYDEGSAVPSCYLLAFADHQNNVFVLDGWYETGFGVEKEAQLIKACRRMHDVTPSRPILADPSVFRTTKGHKVAGKSTAEMFKDEGVHMQRANNDIINGIKKVQSYLNLQQFHVNPITHEPYAPYLYFASELLFIQTEIADYYWKKDPKGELTDAPQEKNDHAMDTLKYLLTFRPKLATLIGKPKDEEPAYFRWHEVAERTTTRRSRRAA